MKTEGIKQSQIRSVSLLLYNSVRLCAVLSRRRPRLLGAAPAYVGFALGWVDRLIVGHVATIDNFAEDIFALDRVLRL